MLSMRSLFLASLMAASAVIPAHAADADPAPAAKDWTILVYLNANNNLEPFSALNMNEMEVVGSNDHVNVVVEVTHRNATNTLRYLMQKDADLHNVTSPVLETMPHQDMGDPATLKAFIQWGMQKYPAKHYLVDIWNHGSGWEKSENDTIVRGVSYDDSTGHHINTPQLGQVLRDVAAGRNGQKIDVISYDACLMQMAEVAAEVADGAIYQVASEETIPGKGWPYTEWLAQVAQHPEWDGAGVGRSIVETYKASYSGGSHGTSGSTLSLVDLSKIGAVSAAADAFSQAVAKETAARPAVTQAINATQAYAVRTHHDINDFVDQVTKRVPAQTVADTGKALKAAVNAMVLANGSTGANLARSNGLAIWIPTTATPTLMSAYKELAWAKSGTWLNFVTALCTNSPTSLRELARAWNARVLEAIR